MRANPGKTPKDAYMNEDTIKYRNIVMCPGHLVAKWAKTIKDEVPYAKVTMLTEFSQLIELRNKGIERTSREFYVISKDFAKLSYQSKPIPRKRRYGAIMKKVCTSCEKEVYEPGKQCTYCGSTELKYKKAGIYETGMVCHHCSNILVPYKTFTEESDTERHTLDHFDFSNQNNMNARCYYCDDELWQPHVANYGDSGKRNSWYKATHYSNKAHKAKKTVWVHKLYDQEYFDYIQEEPLKTIDTDERKGVRKVSPAYFIKRYLKGYFDIAIFDEAHLYKSGNSAQANCMSAIISSSSKQLALTGTIAGGKANDLFYLLYRLDPRRMKNAGYNWSSETKFVEKYGVIEKKFEVRESSYNYNASSKGRQIGSPSVKPGISPLIFMDFLLDRTVFLDLTDMSRYLPPLKEIVEVIDIPMLIEDKSGNMIPNPEIEIISSYKQVIETLKARSKEPGYGGRGLLSAMLQFSLSYLDKPYGIPPIKSPFSGGILATPKDFQSYSSLDVLTSKEKRLIEIINKEQSECRNVVVYAEYTGSLDTCVTERLQLIIEKYCNLEGKVVVLNSSNPTANKREEWLHKKAEEGYKVIITNPRNVETGCALVGA